MLKETSACAASHVDRQLARLQDERAECVRRLKELFDCPNRTAEINGYLALIENINEAAIQLARSLSRQCTH